MDGDTFVNLEAAKITLIFSLFQALAENIAGTREA